MIQIQDLPVVPLPDEAEKGKGAFDVLKGLTFDDAITTISNGLVTFAWRLLGAALAFYVGKFIIKKVYEIVNKVLIANDVEASLTTFLLSLTKILLYFLLIIAVVGILGIETSSFLALFASASVAVGLALSGTLQNFAGGVLILLLKPYKVGDYIEAQGFAGTVKEVQIFHTVINTMDNKTILIPNGGLSTSSVNNYSLESYRRVDWKIGLCYGCDSEKAKQLFMKILLSDNRVVVDTLEEDMNKREESMPQPEDIPDNDCPEDDPDCDPDKLTFWQRMRNRNRKKKARLQMKLKKKTSINLQPTSLKVSRPPFVAISELADSSVNFTIRAWTHKSNYWDLFFEMNERFYRELPENGFEFPFPQMDVHIADMPQNMPGYK